MKRGTVLAWPGLTTPLGGLFSLALWPGKEGHRHTEAVLSSPGAVKSNPPPQPTHPPPPLTSPKKLALTQYSPRRLRMTAELTAAICFEVSSQVLPLSHWVDHRAAQVHNSAVVCACRCSHTSLWLHVYVYTELSLPFPFRASVYIILLSGPSCSAFLMWEKRLSAQRQKKKKHHPVKQFLLLILWFLK